MVAKHFDKSSFFWPKCQGIFSFVGATTFRQAKEEKICLTWKEKSKTECFSDRGLQKTRSRDTICMKRTKFLLRSSSYKPCM